VISVQPAATWVQYALARFPGY